MVNDVRHCGWLGENIRIIQPELMILQSGHVFRTRVRRQHDISTVWLRFRVLGQLAVETGRDDAGKKDA